MEIDNIRKRIWLIPDGVPLKLDNMTIRTTRSDILLVIGCTRTIEFKNLSKGKVLQELEELKYSFSRLSKTFSELNAIVKTNNLRIEYHMTYDDPGKVGIGLCSEIEGEINW